MADQWKDRALALERLYKVGIALSAEKDKNRLVELILLEAKDLCHADGGTIYLVDDDASVLRFAILRNDTLKTKSGGTTGETISLAPVPLVAKDGSPNRNNVASFCAVTGKSVNIADAYTEPGFDFSGTKAFDKNTGYRSQSFLTIPMQNTEGRVIGVLQLINARDAKGAIIAFDADRQEVVEALASQAAIALENRNLLLAQKELLESFIKLIANAIDAKSPYTGGHCTRVPILTEMLATAAVAATDGPLKDFSLSADEWYELRIAAWLHDCGKVVTPVHVMDKATKLETISDRIEGIRDRFELLRAQARLAAHDDKARRPDEATEIDEALAALLLVFDEELAFLEKANVGGEFLPPDKQQRIRQIGARPIVVAGVERALLTVDEVENLCISRGTLTEEERLIINGHMVQTIRMLESLPFPPSLRRVPEYAGGHHEKMDGTGYPKGLFAGDMSIPARMMAIADVFEALTATDRPYKAAKTLSATMKIMSFMKADNHLDPDLFDFFVTSGVYKAYAAQYLTPDLIDDVDEAALLAIKPKPYTLPPKDERQQRWQDFLPPYRVLVT
jgi:HD-GYP domain-containing protein (c-di-GMP phosphodiesterase class II)